MSEAIFQERTTEPRNELEQAALDYAQIGWSVFPLHPRTKVPATPHGFKDATTDEAQIREWWGENPDYNVGIATGNGLVVLDADSSDAIESLMDLPATKTVRTSRGKHFYYESSGAFKKSNSRLWDKVDVQGIGACVVAPPSIHPDGTRYEWEDEDTPVAPLPRERLEGGNASPTTETDDDNAKVYDGERNDWLKTTAGNLVRRCVDAGFSEAETQALLRAQNEEHCIPALARSVVDRMAANFYSSQLNQVAASELRLFSRDEIDNLPQPEFLIEDILVKNSVAILFGEPGGAKTFVAVALAVSVAAGSPWYGRKACRAPVVYVCAEGYAGLQSRIKANEMYNGLQKSANLHVIYSAIQLQKPTAVAALISLLKKQNVRPGLVIIDTLSRCTVGVDENAAKEMSMVVAGLERIKREFEATVLVVHHSTKADGKTIRGSSVILAGVDTALALTTRKQNERVLTIEKQKESEHIAPLTFVLQNVGDSKIAVPVLMNNLVSAPSLTDNDKKALHALADVGPASFTTWMAQSGLVKATFNRSRTRLVKGGFIRKGDDDMYGVIARAA